MKSFAAAVRTNLYRKAAKDAAWIKNKKAVIWCFSAREFTESTSGWIVVRQRPFDKNFQKKVSKSPDF